MRPPESARFPHLGGELFKLTAGIDLLHVPFKGSAPALIDVVGGHTQLTFATIPSSLTHIRSGKLKVFGVGGMRRNALIPEVPTVDEAGLPGYAAANWNGIIAPAGTPAPVIARLHKEISEILATPEMQKQFVGRGRRRRADEPDRVRGVYRLGTGKMGPCREGSRHQTGVGSEQTSKRPSKPKQGSRKSRGGNVSEEAPCRSSHRCRCTPRASCSR